MDKITVLSMETLEKTDKSWYTIEHLSNGDFYLHEMFKENESDPEWSYHVCMRIPNRMTKNLRKYINFFLM